MIDYLNQLSKNSFTEIHQDIQWLRMDDKKQSAIILTSKGDMTNKNDWSNQLQWFKENLEIFTNFFKPIIKKM